MNRFPPGPKSHYPGQIYFRFRKDPIGFLEDLAREFGDMSHWRIGLDHVFFINHPNLIRDVLVTESHKFLTGFASSKDIVGEGVLTSNGDRHRSHRRMMQTAFNHERIAPFADTITKQTHHAASRWHDGSTLNLAKEMMQMTLVITGKILLGVDWESEAPAIRTALDGLMGSPSNMILSFGHLLQKIPVPSIRRMKAGRAKLNQIVNELIDQRLTSNEESDDLLSMLCGQAETGAMTLDDVRDEVKTILIAGHETVSTVLIWTFHLLSRHPSVESQLHEELDRVVGTRLPALADLPALPYLEKVIREVMRLHPPVWMIWRRSTADHQINGFVAPSRSIIIMSQHVMHRDARYFSEPLQFDPERWTPELKSGLPKCAYFPFGSGNRQCLGEGLAWMETLLTVATLGRQWKFQPASENPVIADPILTQRPKGGLLMIPHRR